MKWVTTKNGVRYAHAGFLWVQRKEVRFYAESARNDRNVVLKTGEYDVRLYPDGFFYAQIPTEDGETYAWQRNKYDAAKAAISGELRLETGLRVKIVLNPDGTVAEYHNHLPMLAVEETS